MSSQGQEPTEEQLLEALRRVKVEDVVFQTVATLVNLAGQKLTVPEAKDTEEARRAIDAARAMLPLLPDEELGPVRDALSQVQMLYVRETGAPPGPEPDAGGPAPEPGGGEMPGAADERAKARAKIWTPPGS